MKKIERKTATLSKNLFNIVAKLNKEFNDITKLGLITEEDLAYAISDIAHFANLLDGAVANRKAMMRENEYHGIERRRFGA